MKKQPALEEQSNLEPKNQEKDDSYTQNTRLRAKILRDFLSNADMKFAGMLLRNTCEDITPQRRLPEKVNADNDHSTGNTLNISTSLLKRNALTHRQMT